MRLPNTRLLFCAAALLIGSPSVMPADAQAPRQTQPALLYDKDGRPVAAASATPASGAPAPKLLYGKDGKLLPPPAPEVPTVKPSAPQRSQAQPATQVVTGDQAKTIVVGSGGPFTFSAKNSDEFATLFAWRPDGTNDPLKLTVTAASFTGNPRVRWMRVLLGNQVLATEKNFKGDTLELDLSGRVPAGTNQIVIQGGGIPGSSAKFTLTSVLNPKMLAIDPDEICVGDSFKIKGTNFDPDLKKMRVIVGKKEVQITSGSSTELKCTVPKSFPIDEHPVTLMAYGKPCPGSGIKLTVRGIPRLTGKSLDGVPPGYKFAVFGENFAKKLADNQVWLGDVPAQVVEGNTEQLFIICPSEGGNFYAPHNPDETQKPLEIRLKVGKIECKNKLPIFVGNSVWQDGMRGGPDTEVVPVDVRSNF